MRNKFLKDNLFKVIKSDSDCDKKTSKPTLSNEHFTIHIDAVEYLQRWIFIFIEINNPRVLLTRSREIDININIVSNPQGFPSLQQETDAYLSVYLWLEVSGLCQPGRQSLCLVLISDNYTGWSL